MPATAVSRPENMKAPKRIIQTWKPSAFMRRGWSRVPASAAPNGERTKIAEAATATRKTISVMS